MQRSEILKEVHAYVLHATSSLQRKRYTQESAYVDAFLGRLDGVIDLGEDNGLIELRPTIVADRGPGAAEHKYGADFALVFSSEGGRSLANKAILAQAKNGYVELLSNPERQRLEGQCEKMASVTHHYFVLEAPTKDFAIPTVRLGTYEDQKWSEKKIPFDEYLVDQVISCLHGDRRTKFIQAGA